MGDTCCCSHGIAEHTPHLLRCTVKWCDCQRFHTSGDWDGHAEERRLAAELEKEKTMHDTPNPGKSDHPTLAVQRTVTYTAFLAEDSAPYKLFEHNPEVHTITLESDTATTTYTRIEEEED